MSPERAEVILPLADLGAAPITAQPRITIPIAPPSDHVIVLPVADLLEPPIVEAPPVDASAPVAAPMDVPDSQSLDDLLAYAVRRGASDLILGANSVPRLRIEGVLTAIPDCPVLDGVAVEGMLAATSSRLRERLAVAHQVRYAYTSEQGGRFRVEVFEQRSSMTATFRVVPAAPPEIASLGLASILDHIAELASGLVIVAGPVASGRSTTIAAIVAAANRSRNAHIVTIEDPIEVLHANGSCVVSQREVGVDVDSVTEGLTSAARVGADIVVVGDLVGLADIELALAAAESGLLVLASSTGATARGVIARMVEVTTAQQQPQLRARLAASLQAIAIQVLCPAPAGEPRVPATEVLVATDAVRELIREGRLDQLPQAMIEGSKVEMHTLNQRLADLVRDGRVTLDVAMERCSDATELRRYLGGVG